MYLASFAGSRDNNFNLVRLLAAIAVVVSHGFYLVLGGKEFEPGYSTLGATPGSLAVDVFFVVSGFLVTRSLEYRRSVVEFACARALRI
jgi:peptidoglycan/LPS O-acetylase OafA/YrhL